MSGDITVRSLTRRLWIAYFADVFDESTVLGDGLVPVLDDPERGSLEIVGVSEKLVTLGVLPETHGASRTTSTCPLAACSNYVRA